MGVSPRQDFRAFRGQKMGCGRLGRVSLLLTLLYNGFDRVKKGVSRMFFR